MAVVAVGWFWYAGWRSTQNELRFADAFVAYRTSRFRLGYPQGVGLSNPKLIAAEAAGLPIKLATMKRAVQDLAPGVRRAALAWMEAEIYSRALSADYEAISDKLLRLNLGIHRDPKHPLVIRDREALDRHIAAYRMARDAFKELFASLGTPAQDRIRGYPLDDTDERGPVPY